MSVRVSEIPDDMQNKFTDAKSFAKATTLHVILQQIKI
jgi:hypothetical protein